MISANRTHNNKTNNQNVENFLVHVLRIEFPGFQHSLKTFDPEIIQREEIAT